MDVQTIDAAAAAAATEPHQTAPQAAPSVAPAPTHQPRVDTAARRPDETLQGAISQLAGGGAAVNVTFKVLSHPNEIVAVFKDADTGQVISEFPPETMIKIAEFFNKVAGAVLDRQV